MKKPKKIKLKESTGIRVGNVLLARPFSEEPGYHRSVILILNHDESGTGGLILNRENVLSLEIIAPEFNFRKPLYFGGPFHTDQVMFIHNLPEMEGAQQLQKGIFMGSDNDSLRKLMRSPDSKKKRVRFYNGIVKWSAGQLEYEIEHKAWWMTTVPGKELLRYPVEKMWNELALSMGHVYGLVGDMEDPNMN